MTKELRTLLPEEKEFVRKLSELRKDRSDKNMPNFQSGRILEQIVGFNFAAITWDKDYNEPIKIYYEDKNLEPAACSSFFVLCDYLFLLEELESAGLMWYNLPCSRKNESYITERNIRGSNSIIGSSKK